jgi:hypothetical protein
MAEKHASTGGIFVRLANDGDKVVGAFCGEPDAREVHWTGERYEECAGPGCALCGAGTRPSLRVTINFWVAAENAMKVMEGGTMWFRDVLAVKDKYGLDRWTFEVKRVGKPKDPKTKYAILPETNLDEATKKRIAACPLHELAALGRVDAHEPAATDARTVTLAEANELLEELHDLSKPEVERFFAAFKIPRLRDLHAEDLAAARSYLARSAGDDKDDVPF